MEDPDLSGKMEHSRIVKQILEEFNLKDTINVCKILYLDVYISQYMILFNLLTSHSSF